MSEQIFVGSNNSALPDECRDSDGVLPHRFFLTVNPSPEIRPVRMSQTANKRSEISDRFIFLT